VTSKSLACPRTSFSQQRADDTHNQSFQADWQRRAQRLALAMRPFVAIDDPPNPLLGVANLHGEI
jgi:hypothetical protein